MTSSEHRVGFWKVVRAFFASLAKARLRRHIRSIEDCSPPHPLALSHRQYVKPRLVVASRGSGQCEILEMVRRSWSGSSGSRTNSRDEYIRSHSRHGGQPLR